MNKCHQAWYLHSLRLKIHSTHFRCKVSNKYLKVCNAETEIKIAPLFPWCPMNHQCLRKKTRQEEILAVLDSKCKIFPSKIDFTADQCAIKALLYCKQRNVTALHQFHNSTTSSGTKIYNYSLTEKVKCFNRCEKLSTNNNNDISSTSYKKGSNSLRKHLTKPHLVVQKSISIKQFK